MHSLQDLIVAALVAGCAVYVVWTLMPAAARRAVAGALLKLPLPERFALRMRRAATASSGCGCDGCDHAPEKTAKASPAAPQVVTFHRPTKR
jgi:hypothetical protein